MPEPSISVVIPAYNAEKTLDRALRSVLAQTRPPEQIIVVDDGSRDRTLEIARSYAPRVESLTQPNAGAAAARNTGIAHARMEFIALLDADDEWLPEHLEQAVESLTRNPDLVWYSSAYERRELAGVTTSSQPPEATLDADGCIRDYLEAAPVWTNWTTSTVIRRAVIEALGGFDVSMPTAEDLDLYFRIALEHPRIGYGRRLTAVLHETAGSLTTQLLFTRERASALAQKWEGVIARSPRAGDPGARRYLLKWIMDLLRVALNKADRTTVAWIDASFGDELPPRWRQVTRLCLALPDPLWRAIAGAWRGSRGLRNRFRR